MVPAFARVVASAPKVSHGNEVSAGPACKKDTVPYHALSNSLRGDNRQLGRQLGPNITCEHVKAILGTKWTGIAFDRGNKAVDEYWVGVLLDCE